MKQIHYKQLVGGALMVLLTACQPSASECAEVLLQEADAAYQAGQLGKAIVLVDSLETTYRHEIDTRKKAHVLLDHIHLRQAERNQVYFDSLVTLQQPIVDELMVDFRLSSDTTYVSLKSYRHKNQVQWYYPHNNLLCDVNERGEVSLISVYTGNPLDHHTVRVSSGDFFTETIKVPVNDAANYSFKDEGTHWEYVTYNENTENGVLAFIHEQGDARLKVVLTGDKGRYVYYLEKSDKEALAAAYDFAQAMKSLYDVKKNARIAREKIDYLTHKLN